MQVVIRPVKPSIAAAAALASAQIQPQTAHTDVTGPSVFGSAATLEGSVKELAGEKVGAPVPELEVVCATEAISDVDPMALALAKAQLLDHVYGTSRGLDASLSMQIAVESLLSSLESMSTNLGPAAALRLLNGRCVHKLVHLFLP